MRRLIIQYYLYIDGHAEVDSFEVIKQHTKALNSYINQLQRTSNSKASAKVMDNYASIKSQLTGVQEEISTQGKPLISTVFYLNEGMTRVENALDNLAQQTNSEAKKTHVAYLLISTKLAVLNMVRWYGVSMMETLDGKKLELRRSLDACRVADKKLHQLTPLSQRWSAHHASQFKRLLRQWQFAYKTLCGDRPSHTFFLAQADGAKISKALERLLDEPMVAQQLLK